MLRKDASCQDRIFLGDLNHPKLCVQAASLCLNSVTEDFIILELGTATCVASASETCHSGKRNAVQARDARNVSPSARRASFVCRQQRCYRGPVRGCLRYACIAGFLPGDCCRSAECFGAPCDGLEHVRERRLGRPGTHVGCR